MSNLLLLNDGLLGMFNFSLNFEISGIISFPERRFIRPMVNITCTKSATNIFLIKNSSTVSAYFQFNECNLKKKETLRSCGIYVTRSRPGLSAFHLTSSVSYNRERKSAAVSPDFLTGVCMFAQQVVSREWHVRLLSRICILLWSIEGYATMAAFKFEQVPLDHFYYDNHVWTSGNSWENVVGEKPRVSGM